MQKTGIKPLDNYCEGVKSGGIPVCKWVQKAVERHYDDLDRWGVGREQAIKNDCKYYFEPDAAKHYVNFFQDYLPHYEGAVSGDPIIFEPWQWFVYGSIFGWLKTDRFKDIPIRRFRTAIIIVPKKNGKSIISGGTGLYMMDRDGWPGAQCYILAKNQKHAMDLGYRAAVNMVENSDFLNERYKINYGAMNMGVHFTGNNNSFYKPITSKPDSEDGRNVHFCGPDETKDWTDFEIYEVMRNGTVNAPNSLFMSTTTAGSNKKSLGYHQQEDLEKVLNGTVSNESLFGVIYGIDEEDKLDEDGNEKEGWWLDRNLWEKANPNYNVSVYESALESIADEAKGSFNKQAAFKCKHLNEWVDSANGFITHEKWIRCNTKDLSWDDFKGRRCYAGLDLGEISDFSAFAVVGEPTDEDDRYIVKVLYWIPELTLKERDNVNIIAPWIEEGWITTTSGNATDYDQIKDDIEDILDSGVKIEKMICDSSKAQNLPSKIGAEFGIEVAAVSQRASKMNAPIEEIMKTVFDEDVEFGNDPVLAWMNSNVVVKENYNNEKRFDKGNANDKFDGMQAMAMAFMPVVDEQEETEDEYTGYGMLA